MHLYRLGKFSICHLFLNIRSIHHLTGLLSSAASLVSFQHKASLTDYPKTYQVYQAYPKKAIAILAYPKIITLLIICLVVEFYTFSGTVLQRFLYVGHCNFPCSLPHLPLDSVSVFGVVFYVCLNYHNSAYCFHGIHCNVPPCTAL